VISKRTYKLCRAYRTKVILRSDQNAFILYMIISCIDKQIITDR